MSLNHPTTFSLKNSKAYYQKGLEAFESSDATFDSRKTAKRFVQFSLLLNNVYKLTLENVEFSYFSYMNDVDQITKSNLMRLTITEPVPSFEIYLKNLTLKDIFLEDQYLILLNDMELRSSPVENIMFDVQKLKIQDCYFFNDTGLIYQKSEGVAGKLNLVDIDIDRTNFIQSNGLISLNTLVEAKITNLTFQNSLLETTALLTLNLVSGFNIKA